MRLLKLVVVVILAALAALVGYAYFGDMEPRQQEIRVPLTDPTSETTDSETDGSD